MHTFIQDFLKYWPFTKTETAFVMAFFVLLAAFLIVYPHFIRWYRDEDDFDPEYDNYEDYSEPTQEFTLEYDTISPELPNSSGIWKKVGDNIVSDDSDSEEFPWQEEMKARSTAPAAYSDKNWYKNMLEGHKRWVSDMRDEIYEIGYVT